MALTFPSVEWMEEYKRQINSSEGYKKAGATWTAGVVALVISAKPEIGINEDFGMWLDLHQGVCREAKKVGLEEAQKAPFCIIGDGTGKRDDARKTQAERGPANDRSLCQGLPGTRRMHH
jgi:hypothetical protein